MINFIGLVLFTLGIAPLFGLLHKVQMSKLTKEELLNCFLIAFVCCLLATIGTFMTFF